MQKAELTKKMLVRIEEIQQAGYKYLQALLEVDDEKMKELGPWTEEDAEYEVVGTEEGFIEFKEKGSDNRYQLQVTVQEG